jgi:hypothetical protein
MFNTAHQRQDDDELYDSQGFAAELQRSEMDPDPRQLAICNMHAVYVA